MEVCADSRMEIENHHHHTDIREQEPLFPHKTTSLPLFESRTLKATDTQLT
jgi:hypothetical protein